MTLDQLLDQPVEFLEKLSDKELEEYLKPYFNVTRPDLAVKPVKKTGTSKTGATRSGSGSIPNREAQMKAKMRELQQNLGIDLGVK